MVESCDGSCVVLCVMLCVSLCVSCVSVGGDDDKLITKNFLRSYSTRSVLKLTKTKEDATSKEIMVKVANFNFISLLFNLLDTYIRPLFSKLTRTYSLGGF